MEGAGIAAYYLVAAAAQWALGFFLLIGRRRDDALFVMGILFAANGSLALLQLVIALNDNLGLEYAATRTLFLFDQLTNLCILYFALAYPHKIRLLERRPWLIRGAFIGTAMLYVLATFAEPLLNGATYRAAGVKPDVWWLGIFNAFYLIVNAGVFAFLIVRWAWLLRHMESVPQLRQFRLIFAAFALRAVHLHVRGGFPKPFSEPGGPMQWATATWRITDVGSLLNHSATVAAVIILILAMVNAPPERRSAAKFVLAFMAAGLVEGLIARDAWVTYIETRNVSNFLLVLGSVDYLFIRPLMVWLAMASHHFASTKWRSVRASQGVVLVFALPTFYGGFLALNSRNPDGWVFALLASLVVSGGLAWALQRPLQRMLDLANKPAESEDGSNYYTAVLQDLHRRGPIDEEARNELQRLASHLGLAEEQTRSIDASLAARAGPTAGYV